MWARRGKQEHKLEASLLQKKRFRTFRESLPCCANKSGVQIYSKTLRCLFDKSLRCTSYTCFAVRALSRALTGHVEGHSKRRATFDLYQSLLFPSQNSVLFLLLY